jgi:uncharacterized protein YdaU (DUF1376 family)
MKSPPAFQFYPADWLSSQRVQMLTLEEEGAYIRLVASCWQHGSIPADPEKCARLIGKGASTTLATVVQAMFQPDPNDSTKLVHDRLDLEREKQANWRQKSAEGGKKSAEKRAANAKNKIDSPSKTKGGSRVVEPPHQPNANSSSSSSSSNTPISPKPPAPPSLVLEVQESKPSLSPEQIEVGSWFNRRPTTPWSEKELKTWAKIPKPIDSEDWQALRWFYTQSGCQYLRRDIPTLLNNWTGEIDRAKNYNPDQK